MLCTVAEAKEFLRLTENDYDVLIENIITRASAIIEGYCSRTFASAQYSELYDGSGDDDLMLDHYPLISLDEYSEDYDIATATARDAIDVSTILLQKDSGIIIPSDFTIAEGKKNIFVKYTAGYAAVPEDVKAVCVEMVAKKQKDSAEGRFGIASKSVMAENVTYSYQDLNTFQKSVLDGYVSSKLIRGVTVQLGN